jgi:hypothetical protein
LLVKSEAAITIAALQQLDAISKDLWRQHGLGLVSEGDATRIAEMIEARRRAIRQHTGMKTAAPPRVRKAQRSPKPSESKCRRRRLAYSGPHPPNVAQWFTESGNAVLKVIGDETAAKGECRLCVDQIAAIAGCSRATVQRATRAARMRGLLTIEERRCSPTKNLPNIIRIISKEWLTWLERGFGRRTTLRCGIRPAVVKTDAPP